MKLEVRKCNEDSKVEGDPDCSTDAEIHEWVHNKKLIVKFLDYKVQLKDIKDKDYFRTMKQDILPLHKDHHIIRIIKI